MSRRIYIIFYFLLLWVLAHMVLITIDGCMDDYNPSDAAIVLGNTVYENGSMSARLKARMEKGLELYRNGYVRQIIVTGGLGKEGHYEAEVMKQFLLTQGVPQEAIITDNKGDNTYLSAVNCKKIFDKRKLHSIIVVSSFSHLTRCKLIFRKAGMEKITTAHSVFFEGRDLLSLFREFFAYYQYLFL